MWRNEIFRSSHQLNNDVNSQRESNGASSAYQPVMAKEMA
jgi:hypothetical protein